MNCVHVTTLFVFNRAEKILFIIVIFTIISVILFQIARINIVNYKELKDCIIIKTFEPK